ncbi:MAG: indolepyruvate oxidoreductase subunit beta family protein [Rhodospirillaceae bacterium]|jgi:indolepyruvate ferredoxin oxidoreductase, beta subunit|nr:indolepyruvate oxidoreductase subunit beta family protein [Rhodospirillaceae bacterium]MBT5244448.1 indolepyruvate oxidoreductase subunit beta family protein [Rhodospirillaceae bacterium]MBT5561391.1 indolepyruvate oxidoreductase subunit beta family protein [Rhodospirillaceae bacterium]MBT6242030.1 indolepyruvate oxidoreductase subunit beta family protein [Rhodospirillaceae bacterium]MBT7136732.1 indolepyruvate oxidoreductase subunit beta family protein [Rhodospirillaceae bacterium]
MAANETPIKILIAALGGDGGGTLTNWIVNAARLQDLPVQATSVPGVAQRTGATSYYIEIFPTANSELNDRKPVFDLYPGPGDVDLVIATELLEIGRAIKRGFVSSTRTTVVASNHRVYALAEKMIMGDGRFGDEAIIKAVDKMSKASIMLDVKQLAEQAGSALNAVLLGVVAASGVLPIKLETFERGISQAGKAVDANLAGFVAGLSSSAQKEPDPGPTAAPAPKGKAEGLKTRIERDFPQAAHAIMFEAAMRCLDYQDPAHADAFVDRLDGVCKLPQVNPEIMIETARHLGRRMTYEDIMRVAQLKTRASRFARVRREVGAEPEQIVQVSEFLKPGPEEIADALPRFLGRPLTLWARANPEKARKIQFGLRVRTDTILGFAMVRMIAAFRRFRRINYRFGEEQAWTDHWLHLVGKAISTDPALAFEVVKCAGLVKGYGDTYKRGAGNFTLIADTLIIPAVNGAQVSADDVARARQAAQTDSQGLALKTILDDISTARSDI